MFHGLLPIGGFPCNHLFPWLCPPPNSYMWSRGGGEVGRKYWMIYSMEDQAFLRLYDSTLRPPPSPHPPSASDIIFSFFLCVASWAYSRERGRRGWARSQIIRRRESLALYKSFNTLWEGVSITDLNLGIKLFKSVHCIELKFIQFFKIKLKCR